MAVHLRHLHLDKISELEKHKALLLDPGVLGRPGSSGSGSNEKNVKELIEYIECQRDVYKTSVESLLQKLDPGRKVLNQVDSMIEQELLERSQSEGRETPGGSLQESGSAVSQVNN